jgi:tetratricopeptide (TPR) repeat protein
LILPPDILVRAFMNFKPSTGLFQFDFNDQHAILGVAVDSDAGAIRNRYKEIARLMHPDSSCWSTSTERELAVKLFSNLITHAYGNLSRATLLQEQQMMLELMGKRLVSEASKIDISSKSAQQLFQKNTADLHESYTELLQELAAQQYRQLEQSVDITGQISELNMIYLLRKQNQSIRPSTSSSSSTGNPSVAADLTENIVQASTPASVEVAADASKATGQKNSMRRADEYINMRNWAKANVELREVLKGEPNNAQAHAQLAIVYTRQNQATMAKMHMNKALQIAPEDPLVKTAKQEFKKLASSSAAKTTSDQSKGKLFGLFGKK